MSHSEPMLWQDPMYPCLLEGHIIPGFFDYIRKDPSDLGCPWRGIIFQMQDAPPKNPRLATSTLSLQVSNMIFIHMLYIYIYLCLYMAIYIYNSFISSIHVLIPYSCTLPYIMHHNSPSPNHLTTFCGTGKPADRSRRRLVAVSQELGARAHVSTSRKCGQSGSTWIAVPLKLSLRSSRMPK